METEFLVATMQRPFGSIGAPLAGEFSKAEPRQAHGLPSWNPSHLLKRLERAVNEPKTRRIGKRTPDELIAARVKIDQADIKALKQLKRLGLTRSRSKESIPPRAGWWGRAMRTMPRASPPLRLVRGLVGEGDGL